MSESHHPQDSGQVLRAGAALDDASLAVILLHGRGASAADILALGRSFTDGQAEGIVLLAPQATNNTWYPASGFLPPKQLAPWLESALMIIDTLVDTALDCGIAAEKIVVGGFSQGAMLSLEYAARGRRRIGGVIAFSGSPIGPVDLPHAPLADATGLRMFIGCGTNDSWITASSAKTSAELFKSAGAEVDHRVYDGMEHTINQDEIDAARVLIAAIQTSGGDS